jgi:hypothetical protein
MPYAGIEAHTEASGNKLSKVDLWSIVQTEKTEFVELNKETNQKSAIRIAVD